MPTASPEAAAALKNVKTIAIVGLSPKPERPSHQIAVYLKQHGYEIIPVRPGIAEIMGGKAYSSLLEYGRTVDIVNIFRRPEAVPEIVEQAMQIGCRIVWMQEGICHEEAAGKARSAGIKVVQNKCILKVHRSIKSQNTKRKE
ncbi:CoA-binding protein [bacterium]|nr:CoA-binding protein [bacterium]